MAEIVNGGKDAMRTGLVVSLTGRTGLDQANLCDPLLGGVNYAADWRCVRKLPRDRPESCRRAADWQRHSQHCGRPAPQAAVYPGAPGGRQTLWLDPVGRLAAGAERASDGAPLAVGRCGVGSGADGGSIAAQCSCWEFWIGYGSGTGTR